MGPVLHVAHFDPSDSDIIPLPDRGAVGRHRPCAQAIHNATSLNLIASPQ